MPSTHDTPPPSHQDPEPVPVPAHLVPLPDSRPPTPELKDSPPDQSLSNASSLRETDTKDKGAIDTVRDSEKKVEQVGSLSSPPNIRRIIEPLPWSRPPQFSVQYGEAIVNERLRKAFCAEIGCPLVPLRSHIIPTPTSFGETRESLEARRTELKSAGYSHYQIEGSSGHYRTNPTTGIWEIQLIADRPQALRLFPTDVIRIPRKIRDSTGGLSTKIVSFVVHKRVLAAFFAHVDHHLKLSFPVSRPSGYSIAFVRRQWLPVFTVLNGKPDVYEVLLDYIYGQNPETVLRSLLGDRAFPQISPCTEEICEGTPRSISALPIAERRTAVQIQEEHTYDEIVNTLTYLDEIFYLADELGLESPPFWNALACVRRIVLDAGAITHFNHLKAMADIEAASCA